MYFLHEAGYQKSHRAYTTNLTPQVLALLENTHFTKSSPFLSLSSEPRLKRPADLYPASISGSSTSSSSFSTPTNSPTSRPPESNGLKAGHIAGIAVGGCAALLLIAISIGYLFRRRRASQKPGKAIPTSSNEYNEGTAVTIKQDGLAEMDGATRVGELQEHGIQELEHPVPAVELQS